MIAINTYTNVIKYYLEVFVMIKNILFAIFLISISTISSSSMAFGDAGMVSELRANDRFGKASKPINTLGLALVPKGKNICDAICAYLLFTNQVKEVVMIYSGEVDHSSHFISSYNGTRYYIKEERFCPEIREYLPSHFTPNGMDNIVEFTNYIHAQIDGGRCLISEQVEKIDPDALIKYERYKYKNNVADSYNKLWVGLRVDQKIDWITEQTYVVAANANRKFFNVVFGIDFPAESMRYNKFSIAEIVYNSLNATPYSYKSLLNDSKALPFSPITVQEKLEIDQRMRKMIYIPALTDEDIMYLRNILSNKNILGISTNLREIAKRHGNALGPLLPEIIQRFENIIPYSQRIKEGDYAGILARMPTEALRPNSDKIKQFLSLGFNTSGRSELIMKSGDLGKEMIEVLNQTLLESRSISQTNFTVSAVAVALCRIGHEAANLASELEWHLQHKATGSAEVNIIKAFIRMGEEQRVKNRIDRLIKNNDSKIRKILQLKNDRQVCEI